MVGDAAEAPLFPKLADYLEDSAEELTDQWLERLSRRLGVRPSRLLPSPELRDHIPEVMRGLAQFMDAPVRQPPNETVDILRALAQLRREQGYDIQELLTEVDVLSDLVFERAAEWAEEQDGLTGAAGVRAAARLTAVLRSITTVAVGTYREEELRQQEELAEQLGEFASMISHEMRNPLSTAAISAEMLTQEAIGEDPEQRQKHAERVLERIDRLTHLLDDVGTLAVAEGARAEGRWLSVRAVIDRVVEEVQPAAERHDVEVRVQEPEDDFDVDAVRVEIALMNLVTNAIKFSDPEKEECWVEIRCGTPDSEGLRGGRQIVVEDNGRGIEPESQNKVFQRFFRGYPEVEGTGLGLSIARRVVEQRGGRLHFESDPGRGTRFCIEIPQRLETAEEEPGEVRR